MTRPARRRGMSDRQVAALRKKAKRYIVPDPELRGHYVRVMPTGPNTFVAVARDPYHKQIWCTLGSADVVTIEEAREKARTAIKRIKTGLPPFEAPPAKPDSFAAVATNWLKRHVEAKGLRTRDEIERCLGKYILPHWREREFETLRRSDVARLLDHVEDNHGRRQADVVLSIVRAIGNWHASRNDDYVSPFVRGMHRADPGAGRRSRVLDDDELRKVWRAAEQVGSFGALVRILLLTAQRLGKVVTMKKWSDVSDAGVWTIPSAPREKGTAGSLKLPKLAFDIIRAQPRYASNEFVFAGRGGGPINDMAAAKAALDEASGVTGWVLHDLRRSARSLMSRADVRPDIAERVLGHAIKGVEGIYDRHRYDAEKADALQRLANLVETIINPPADNVRQLRRRK
jgi:Arm DNA-binding domain/Phage integrase family